MINNVTIAGNLTRDCELRQTGSGFSIANMSVAVNERVKNKQTDQWEDRPNYFDVVLMGSRAEKLSQYLTKGTKVCVSGRLRWSQWERDGQKRSKVEIVADGIEFMSRRDEKPSESQSYEDQELWSSDIPF